MALNYHLVKRPDMRKDAAAGSELYYAQVRALKKVSFEKLCSMIAMRSTAFIGDVMLVIEGLLSVMQEAKGLPQKMISIPLSLTMHASYTYRALCLPISRKMPNLKS